MTKTGLQLIKDSMYFREKKWLEMIRALRLSGNQISDIKHLVDNTGLGSGYDIYLKNNPLSTTSCTVYIPQLENRGVNVYHDCTGSRKMKDTTFTVCKKVFFAVCQGWVGIGPNVFECNLFVFLSNNADIKTCFVLDL